MADISHYIFRISCRSLNILASPAGEGDLLNELGLFMPRAGRESQNVSLLLPIIVSTLLIGTIRYTLCHTLACVLTLQSLRIRSATRGSEIDGGGGADIKEVPVSHQVVDSLSILYRHHGMSIFYKGLHVAVLYHLARTSMVALLGATIFRPTYFQPIADVLSTVAVSELHLYWTQRSVSARQTGLGSWTFSHNRQRWKTLVIPSAAQGTATALLRYISKPLPETAASIEVASWSIVAFAVLRAFLALVTRSLVLSPLSVCLTLIEASFLDPVEETLVYSRRKKCFLPVGTIFSKRDMPLSFERARKQALLSTCLWLLELHVKKCLVQMALESLTFMVIRLMI